MFPAEKIGAIWPRQLEHWLDEHLPMAGEDLEMVDWLYRLPLDHEIFKVTKRRQSFSKLIENLRSEAQKIRSARKQIGLNGIRPVAAEKEPAGWREYFEKLNPGCWLPATYRQLSIQQRQEFEGERKPPL